MPAPHAFLVDEDERLTKGEMIDEGWLPCKAFSYGKLIQYESAQKQAQGHFGSPHRVFATCSRITLNRRKIGRFEHNYIPPGARTTVVILVSASSSRASFQKQIIRICNPFPVSSAPSQRNK